MNEVNTDTLETNKERMQPQAVPDDSSTASSSNEQLLQEIRSKQEHLHQTNPAEFIRFLLLLTKQRPSQAASDEISRALSFMICSQPIGLLHLITASLDLDERSQRQTTFDQRFRSLATIVVGLPCLDRPLSEFYYLLSVQIFRLILQRDQSFGGEGRLSKETSQQYRSIAGAIALVMQKRSSKLACKYLLKPLADCFQQHEPVRLKMKSLSKQKVNEFSTEPNTLTISSNQISGEERDQQASNNQQAANQQSLQIEDALLILSSLIDCHFPAEKLQPMFSRLFYAAACLQTSVSHLRSQVQALLLDILQQLHRLGSKPQHLLVATLFELNHFRLAELFCLHQNLEQGVITVRFCPVQPALAEEDEQTATSEMCRIDNIADTCLTLLNKLPDEVVLDFFLLLMRQTPTTSEFASRYERQQKLLLCALLGSDLQEKARVQLLDHPTQAIEFINSMLDRIAEAPSQSTACKQSANLNEEEASPVGSTGNEKLDKLLREIDNDPTEADSMQIIVQIIETLLDKNINIKEFACLNCSIQKLLAIEKEWRVEGRQLSTELTGRIQRFVVKMQAKNMDTWSEAEQDREFEQAVKDLDSHLLTDRAHALITFKRLIMQKNRNIYNNKDRLLTILKAALSDPESYIYLAAINALSELSLVYTDEVLPIVINEFNDKQRTEDERTRIGQILVNISKQLDDMAPAYAKHVMHAFFQSTQDPQEMIRVSAVCNLGYFCAKLRLSLSFLAAEIQTCISSLAKTDASQQVRRACIFFYDLMLSCLDKNSILAVEYEIPRIYRLLKESESSLDEVMQHHATNALHEIGRIARQLLQSNCKLLSNAIHL